MFTGVNYKLSGRMNNMFTSYIVLMMKTVLPVNGINNSLQQEL